MVVWGNLDRGGDAGHVAAELHSIVTIVPTRHAFFAIKNPQRTIISWGIESLNCPGSQHGFGSLTSDLTHASLPWTNVSNIGVAFNSFAALTTSGELFIWANEQSSVDSVIVQEKLISVISVECNHGACAALHRDGHVVTWGVVEHPADCLFINLHNGCSLCLRREGQ